MQASQYKQCHFDHHGNFPDSCKHSFFLIYGYAIVNKKIEGLTTGSFMAFLSAYSSFQGAFPGVANSLLK